MAEAITIHQRDGTEISSLTPWGDGVDNAFIDKRINGAVTLKFILPRDNPKWDYMNDAYLLRVDGKEFVITGTEEERDNRGELLSNVQCEESWVELGGLYADYLTVEILSSTAENALQTLLAGTGWIVGEVTILASEIHDLETEKESCLFNVRKVQEIWGGILSFDSVNKTVSLYHEDDFGVNRNVEFRYRKNIRSLRRKIDCNVVTRLIPFGKDDLDISSVNGGVIYLEDFSYTNRVIERIWVNQEYEDPAVLKAKAQEAHAKLARPRANYQCNIADLHELTGYQHEEFFLGDWVRVVDDDAGIDATIQIIRHRYNVFQVWQADVEIGDPREELWDQLARHEGLVGDINKSSSAGNILRNIINTKGTEIVGASGGYRLIDGVSTWYETDESGNLTGNVMKASPKGLAISSDGGENFRTAVAGSGVYAAELLGAVIAGANLTISNEAGNFLVDADGVTIEDMDFLLTTSDNMAKINLDPTLGFLIQKNTGTVDTPVWNDQAHFDINGVLNLVDIKVSGEIDCSALKINSVDVLNELDALAQSVSAGALKTGIGGISQIEGSIVMGPGSSITWESLPTDVASASEIPTTPEEIGALPEDALPSYITATKITQTTIESPTITGGEIISNTRIDVGTNIDIGKKVLLNALDWGAGIEWNFSTNPIQIYIDPLGGGLFLNNPRGGIYANDQRIDQPQPAVFG